MLEVFAGRAVAEPVRASVETRTLQLTAADLADVLEDNYDLLSTTRRGIARHLLAQRRGGSATGGERELWRRPAPVLVTGAHTGLVERLVVLRQQLPFARMQALAALAQSASEQTWQAGDVLRSGGDFADGAYVILDGTVRVHRRACELVMAPNDMLGMLETLAEQVHQATLVAEASVRTLRISATALVDVMEDHTDLALALVSQLAGEVLDHPGPAPDLIN